MRQKTYQLQEVALHTMEAGPPDGPAILFLHGFPEFWFGWHNQLDFFANQNYRVIAPDQRGYNLSSKPANVKNYTLEILAADVAELISQLGSGKVVLVGHDWGGAVAWAVADKYPELLEKLIILNMPHLKILNHALRHNKKQMLRSWYAGFFQLPALPEIMVKAFNFKLLERSLTTSSRPGTFTEAELTAYRQAWKQPGAIKAMLNWYRATKYNSFRFKPAIEVPTLMLWGKKDKFLGEELALPSIEMCTNGQLIFLKEASHWLHHEEPDRVNTLILNFLKAG